MTGCHDFVDNCPSVQTVDCWTTQMKWELLEQMRLVPQLTAFFKLINRPRFNECGMRDSNRCQQKPNAFAQRPSICQLVVLMSLSLPNADLRLKERNLHRHQDQMQYKTRKHNFVSHSPHMSQDAFQRRPTLWRLLMPNFLLDQTTFT